MEDEDRIYDFGHMHKPSLYSDAEVADYVGKRIADADDVYKFGLKEIDEIAKSNELTREGKQKALKTAASTVDNLLKPIEQIVAAYDDRVAEIQAEFKPSLRNYDDVVGHALLKETRDYLRPLDPVDRDAFITAAFKEGNVEVMLSIVQAPVYQEFGDKELVEKLKTRLVEIGNPEGTARVRLMRLAQQELTSAVKSVRADLARRGLPSPSSDRSSSQAA